MVIVQSNPYLEYIKDREHAKEMIRKLEKTQGINKPEM